MDTEKPRVDGEQPVRLSRFRMRPCPVCNQQMRCRPGYAEGKAMLFWRCPDHGFWNED